MVATPRLGRRRVAPAALADELGARAAASAEEALAAEIVITVTPGDEVLYPADHSKPASTSR